MVYFDYYEYMGQVFTLYLANLRGKMKNNLDNSVQFDVKWWSTIPAIKFAADFICSKIYKEGDVCLKENRLKNHLKVILTNLYVAYIAKCKPYVAISLNKSNYKKCKRYPKLYLSYKYVSFLIGSLVEFGYIELHKGINFHNFKRNSRIKATQKLLRLFRKYKSDGGVTFRRYIPIVLRDDKKNDIDFDINDWQIKEHIVNVNRINRCLSLHSVSADVPIHEYAEFMMEFAKYQGQNKYTRVFNNSNFENGGRFYRHWTQEVKSKFRKYITIDGQSTVELDYSCLHLSMLYGLECKLPPDGDLYNLIGVDSKYRSIIKKSVNIAINAKDEKTTILAIRDEYSDFIKEYGYTPPAPKVILEAIKLTHPYIQKYFCTNYGVKLQYLDSSIAEKILIHFARRNICCLTIHDSFIIQTSYQDELYSLMIRCFQDLFRFAPRISCKKK